MDRITSFTINHDVLMPDFIFQEKMVISQPMIFVQEGQTKGII